jgi:hypothetical protein
MAVFSGKYAVFSSKSKIIPTSIYGLDDDIDFTWCEIWSYSISGRTKKPIDSGWREFYEEILKYLYNVETDKFKGFLMNNDFIPGIVGTKEKAREELFGNIIKLDEDIYIEGTLSAVQVVKNTKKMFSRLGINYTDVKLYVKEHEGKEINKKKRKKETE